MRTITQNMIIRTVLPADAPALLAIYAPYVEKTAVTFEYEVPSVEEFARRIRETLPRYPWLVAESGKEVLGYACAGAFKDRAAYDWSVETTVYICEDQRGAGLGRALYGALEAQLARQNIRNLYACIAVPREEDPFLTLDSVHFHEHIGYHLAGRFEQCGYKFGRWYDMVWMEKMLGPHPDTPAEFLPYRDFTRTR